MTKTLRFDIDINELSTIFAQHFGLPPTDAHSSEQELNRVKNWCSVLVDKGVLVVVETDCSLTYSLGDKD